MKDISVPIGLITDVVQLFVFLTLMFFLVAGGSWFLSENRKEVVMLKTELQYLRDARSNDARVQNAMVSELIGMKDEKIYKIMYKHLGKADQRKILAQPLKSVKGKK